MEPALHSSALIAPTSPPPPLPETPKPEHHWRLTELTGRVCELGFDGQTQRLSFTTSLLREAQEQGQPTAWIHTGAFGLVVVDLGSHCDLPPGMQSRLAGLARHHQSALMFLTRPSTNGRPGGQPAAGSLGSLVSLRAKGTMQTVRPGYFRCSLTALRDKRHGPGWTREEVRRGPAGLC
jgi:hypothetical protein